MNEFEVFGVESFKLTKKRTIRTAKELHYSTDCITKLKQATTESELTRIMITERRRLMNA